MVREASVSNSGDPLSGLNGPSLFPRTIRASANAPVPSDLKDLDSIHSFMKSLNVLRSPQKLMNEAKKIVDGGAELLESDLAGFTENVGIANSIAAKGKDKPQDRRPALGLGRKRPSFSLKARFSQPSANLAPTFDIDQLEDPDEFFDVYERNENAKKEIQKQLGGSTDNINLYEPKERVRRPGILGKTYKYKHRFSSTPAKVDEMLMSSQETVSQDIPSAHKVLSQEKLVQPDPSPDADLEEDEPASTKKTVTDVNNMLEELLSCNMEDLDGHGALNFLHERLNIMPLDMENLCMTERLDVGRTSVLTASESWKKPRKSSVDIDSVLKNLSRKRHTEQEPGANPINHVSSPTPPKSPLESISLFKKRILQPNPMMDPFSPLNIDLSSCPNASPSQHKDKIIGEADAHQDVGMSSELESRVEFCNPESPVSNINADSHPEQFVDENASIQRAITNSRPNASPAYPEDKLLGQVDAPKDLGMPSELESLVEVDNTEPAVSNMDVQEVMEDEDSLPEQSVDENASGQRIADIRPNEESDNNIGEPMNDNDEDESNPPVIEEEARVDTSSRRQIESEQPLEVPTAKPHRRKTVAGEKRIRNAHPMRKSLAEAGTAFENGVRRSKRIRSRPLEFWKGERFVFGRVENSVKLIGVKCFSPGEGTAKLKVKPYISLETTANKEILELAARH